MQSTILGQLHIRVKRKCWTRLGTAFYCRGNSSRIIPYHIWDKTVHLTLIVRIYTRATSRLLEDLLTISKTLTRVSMKDKPLQYFLSFPQIISSGFVCSLYTFYIRSCLIELSPYSCVFCFAFHSFLGGGGGLMRERAAKTTERIQIVDRTAYSRRQNNAIPYTIHQHNTPTPYRTAHIIQ